MATVVVIGMNAIIIVTELRPLKIYHEQVYSELASGDLSIKKLTAFQISTFPAVNRRIVSMNPQRVENKSKE